MAANPQALSFDDLIPSTGDEQQKPANDGNLSFDDLIPPSSDSPTWEDYGRHLAAGTANIAATTPGTAVEFIGRKLDKPDVQAFGAELEKRGQGVEDYWREGMTPEGASPSTFMGKVATGAVESLPGMLGMATGVEALMPVSRLFGVGKGVEKVAAQFGANTNRAARIGKAAETAIPAGGVEGVVSGLQNAGQTRQEALEMGATEEQANAAADQVLGQTALSTGTIGALTGGGILGRIARKDPDGFWKGAAKGMWEEGKQEFLQSGPEQLIQNLAAQEHYDPSRGAMDDVMESALVGGGSGALLGGFGGGVSGVAERHRQRMIAEANKGPLQKAADAAVQSGAAAQAIPIVGADSSAQTAQPATAGSSPDEAAMQRNPGQETGNVGAGLEPAPTAQPITPQYLGAAFDQVSTLWNGKNDAQDFDTQAQALERLGVTPEQAAAQNLLGSHFDLLPDDIKTAMASKVAEKLAGTNAKIVPTLQRGNEGSTAQAPKSQPKQPKINPAHWWDSQLQTTEGMKTLQNVLGVPVLGTETWASLPQDVRKTIRQLKPWQAKATQPPAGASNEPTESTGAIGDTGESAQLPPTLRTDSGTGEQNGTAGGTNRLPEPENSPVRGAVNEGQQEATTNPPPRQPELAAPPRGASQAAMTDAQARAFAAPGMAQAEQQRRLQEQARPTPTKDEARNTQPAQSADTETAAATVEPAADSVRPAAGPGEDIEGGNQPSTPAATPTSDRGVVNKQLPNAQKIVHENTRGSPLSVRDVVDRLTGANLDAERKERPLMYNPAEQSAHEFNVDESQRNAQFIEQHKDEIDKAGLGWVEDGNGDHMLHSLNASPRKSTAERDEFQKGRKGKYPWHGQGRTAEDAYNNWKAKATVPTQLDEQAHQAATSPKNDLPEPTQPSRVGKQLHRLPTEEGGQQKDVAQPTTDTGAKQAEAKAQQPNLDTVSDDPEMAKLQAEMFEAMKEVGEAFVNLNPFVMKAVEVDSAKMLPALTKVMDIAFRMGFHSFKKNAQFVLAAIRKQFGNEAADALTLRQVKGAYNFMAEGKAAADDEDAVAAVKSLDEITREESSPAVTTPERRNDQKSERGNEPTPPTVKTPTIIKDKDSITQSLADDLILGKEFASITEARKRLTELTGEVIKPGTAEAKQADETIELAGVLAARWIVGHSNNQENTYERLVRLTGQLPNLSQRTSTSVEQQAYSTPLPLSYVASRLAGVEDARKVLEPTAGNGALLIEASPKQAIVNELNGDRRKALQSQGFTVSQEDASKPGAFKGTVDVVIANPPFGVVRDENGVSREFQITPQWRTTEIDHAIAMNALSHLDDHGRAVLIVGAPAKTLSDAGRSDAYNGKAKRAFYYTLYRDYNVTRHFTVSGALYAQQGAAWPVDVIVIEGRGKSARALPAADLPHLINSWEELKNELPTRQPKQKDRTTVPGDAGIVAKGNRPASGNEADQEPAGRGGTGARATDGQPGDVLPELGTSPETPRPDGDQLASAEPTQLRDGDGTGGELDTGELGLEKSPSDLPLVVAFEELYPGDTGALKKRDAWMRDKIPNEQLDTDDEGVGEVVFKAHRKSITNPNSGLTMKEGEYGDIRILYRTNNGKLVFVDGKDYLTLREISPSDSRVKLKADQAVPTQERGNDQAAEGTTNQFQSTYTPSSQAKSVGTLVPRNLATATANALAKVADKHGSVDGYVAQSLNYKPQDIPTYFSAEQVDALALILDSLEQGKGFIIGDQTGVGKGRVVAATIRWAIINKKAPIFVTEKPSLYSDMLRDLTDIGMDNINPIVTNTDVDIPLDDEARRWYDLAEKAKEKGERPPARFGEFLKNPSPGVHARALADMTESGELKDYHVIFTTYNQMQTVARRTYPRHSFLNRMADGGVVIFDESHNAGGTAQKPSKASRQAGQDEHGGRAHRARHMAKVAHGVLYSSATYAKRPEVMDLYFRTDMGKVGDADKLRGALEAGGVPLQQVVAAMLAESGQYIRREKSFDGIAYDTVAAPVNKDFAENSATIMRDILQFDRLKNAGIEAMEKKLKAEGKKITGDKSTGGAGASSTNFTSVMHNLISQMLLMMKVEATAKEAITALQRGEKPVIAVANTMGEAIQEYADEVGIKPGDPIPLTFADLLKRYLNKSRRVTEGEAYGQKVSRELTNEELGPFAVAHYKATMQRIDDLGFRELPISPIDAIRQQIEAAGFKTGEITGRTARVDYSKPTAIFRRRGQEEVSTAGKRKTITNFNSGKLDAVIINQSGATGISLHASERNPKPGQAKRLMIIAQPELNIDTHMQILGRVNRTGQVVLPSYIQLVADIPAEKRPAAVLAKKMAMLNANTSANKRSAVTAKDVPDFMNQYGDQIAAQVMWDNEEWHKALGEPLDPARSGDGYKPDGAIRKVTGRIPLLPLKVQEEVYAEIEQSYTDLIDQLDRMGENALEARTLDLDAKTTNTVELKPKVDNSGSPFSEALNAEELDIKHQGKPMTLEEIDKATLAPFAKEEDPEAALKQHYEALKRQTNADYKTYGEALVEKHSQDDDSKGLDADQAPLQLHWQKVVELLKGHPVGTKVFLKLNLGGYKLAGVIGKIERKGRTVSPVAPSAWKVTFYLADPMRQITLPLSKLGFGEQDDKFIGVPVLAVDASNRDLHTQQFEEGQSVSREKRVMLTGNLLAGYSSFGNGRIVHYTTRSGEIRQGVMMGKYDTTANLQSSQPVSFATPELAAGFVQHRKGTVGAVDLDANDKQIRLFVNFGIPNIKLNVPASKADGGKYFLDAGLRSAIGDDFYKRGDVMQASFPQRQLDAVLNRLYALGVRFEVTSYKQEAREYLKEAAGGVSERDSTVRYSVPAWHGSPHDFDEFKLQHIGTGEGAQAYGWGLYFAGKKEVAQWYKENLTPPPAPFYKGRKISTQKEIRDIFDNNTIFSIISNVIVNNKDSYGGDNNYFKHFLKNEIESKLEEYNRYLNKFNKLPEQNKTDNKSRIDVLKSYIEALESLNIDDFSLKKDGNLYQVDLTPEHADFLDWDKPLSEQSAPVKAKLKTAGVTKDYNANLQDFGSPQTTRGREKRGHNIYAYLAHIKDSEQAASEYLHSIGIPGIAYKDATARGTEKASYNYVIFDDSLVKIQARFAKRQALPFKGMTKQAAQGVVNHYLKGLQGLDGLKIQVYGTQNEAGRGSNKQPIEAEFHIPTNTLRVIAENHQNPAHLLATLREEIVGHYGLRQLLGDEHTQVMNEVEKAAKANPEFRKAWVDLSGRDPRTGEIVNRKAPYFSESVRYDKAEIADEVISKLARAGVENGWMRRIVDLITRLLRKIGVVRGLMTPREAMALLARAERGLQQGNHTDGMRGMVGKGRYSKAAKGEPFGNSEPLLAPNGKPSNLNAMQWEQVRTPEFKAWFGDWENDPANASKVVDKNGEPRIISGFFVKSKTNIPSIPSKNLVAVYNKGVELHDKYDEDIPWKTPVIPYDEIPFDDIDFGWDQMRTTLYTAFYKSGTLKNEMPRFVFAERIGDISKTGVSTNYQDEHWEKGLSVLGVYNEDQNKLMEDNNGIYALFNGGDRYIVGGFLVNHATGSDGEPLLVSAVSLGKKKKGKNFQLRPALKAKENPAKAEAKAGVSGKNDVADLTASEFQSTPEVNQEVDRLANQNNESQVRYSKATADTLEALNSLGAEPKPPGELKAGFLKAWRKLKVKAKRDSLGVLTPLQLVEVSSHLLPGMKDYSRQMSQLAMHQNRVIQGYRNADAKNWQGVKDVTPEQAQRYAEVEKLGADSIAELHQKLGQTQMNALANVQHEATLYGLTPAEGFKPLIDRKETIKQIGVLNQLIEQRSGQEQFPNMRGMESGEGTGKAMPGVRTVANLMDDRAQLRIKMAFEKKREANNERVQALYDALSPEAKRVYRLERDSHLVMSHKIERGLVQMIEDSEIDRKTKDSSISQLRHDFESQRASGDYFPLYRQGDYWAYLQAPSTGETSEQALSITQESADRIRLEARERFSPVLMRQLRAIPGAQMRKSKDQKSFYFTFPNESRAHVERAAGKLLEETPAEPGEKSFHLFQTPEERDEYVAKMRRQEGMELLSQGKQTENLRELEGVSAEFVGKVEDLLSQLGTDPMVQAMQDQIWQLYLKSLPDLSARKHMIHRNKTPGFGNDSLLAYSNKLAHDAYGYARLMVGKPMRETITGIKKDIEAAETPSKLKYTLNRLNVLRQFDEMVIKTGLSNKDVKANARNTASLAQGDGANREDMLEQAKLWDAFAKIVDQWGSSKLLEPAAARARMERKVAEETARLNQRVGAARKILAEPDGLEFASNVYSELQQAHQHIMNPKTSSATVIMNQIGYLYAMAFSPAAWMVNLMQTPVKSMPYVAAKMGVAKTTKAFADASALIFGKLQDKKAAAGAEGEPLAWASVRQALTGEERQAYEIAEDTGRIDNTQAHDLWGFAEEGQGRGTFTRKWSWATGFGFHQTERANREITYLAAFRLARETMPFNWAVDYALDVVDKTHLAYSAQNRSRIMRSGVSRVVFQFKTYSQGMAFLWARSGYQWLLSKSATPEEKAEARRYVLMQGAVQIAAAGVMGLPIGGLWLALKMALDGDDDDPEDFEGEFRQAMADFFGVKGGEAVSKGFFNRLSPVDMHSRLSERDLFWRDMDREYEGKDLVANALMNVAGPSLGVFGNVAGGLQLMSDGHWERGLEKLLPKAAASVLKSGRYATEGARTMKGDALIPEFSLPELAAQAVGFTPARLSERYEENDATKKIEKRIHERRQDLIDRAVTAMQEKDKDKARQAWNDIRQYNLAQPEKKIKRENVLSSERMNLKNRARAVDGMLLDRRLRTKLDKRYEFAG